MRITFYRSHILLIACGTLLIVAALLMPREWYDMLPVNPAVPAPMLKGVTLLQWIMALEGIVLIALGWCRWTYVPLDPAHRLVMRGPADAGTVIGARAALVSLGTVTVFALVLRCMELGADFWIDEIIATNDAREMPFLAVIGSYVRSNVQLLNTLLMKLAIGTFGESEWSARLPAVLFGTAAVPAIYWAARQVTTREVSLGAALLLAVSYHHIFFSQNARGYSFYIFFSLVSSVLLVQALRDDRPRTWILFMLTTVLNFASVLIAGFVFAGHILVGAAAIVIQRLRGQSAMPLLRRLLMIFGVTGLLGFQLYSLQIPQIISYIGASYSAAESGYWLLSLEFWKEVARGLGAGVGPGLLVLAVPFVLFAGIGFIDLVRRQWVLAVSLALPLFLTALLLVIFGLTASPRFFLLGLVVAILTAIVAIDLCVRFAVTKLRWPAIARPVSVAAMVLLLCAASLLSLGQYYAVPKQPYRAALLFAASDRRMDEIVIAVHAAGLGAKYYAAQAGLDRQKELFVANSLNEFDALMSDRGSSGALLITSMPRALRIVHPDLYARIEQEWLAANTFPATIGDGAITVWVPMTRKQP